MLIDHDFLTQFLIYFTAKNNRSFSNFLVFNSMFYFPAKMYFYVPLSSLKQYMSVNNFKIISYKYIY